MIVIQFLKNLTSFTLLKMPDYELKNVGKLCPHF